MRKTNSIPIWIPSIPAFLLLVACSFFFRSTPAVKLGNETRLEGSPDAANGERIYFTATSARGTSIDYRGGPNFGGMMMMGAYLTCVSCHGPEARGGVHMMHMQVMDAPDITFAALNGEAGEDHGDNEHKDEHAGYDLEAFRQAVIEGKHPDGESLNRDMPRWRMSDEDLADLFAYLKALSN